MHAREKSAWIRWLFPLVGMAVVLIAGLRIVSPAVLVMTTGTLPLPVFTDISQQAGLNMKIINGDEMTDYLIDVNGEGACFLDYNIDGFQDIFLTNGSSRRSEASGKRPHDYLLRNNGDGTFTDVTAQAHLGASGWHSGC